MKNITCVFGAAVVVAVSCLNASALIIDSDVTWSDRTGILGVEGGFVEIVTGGSLTANARVDHDGGVAPAGRVILNGGNLTSTVDYKHPDNNTGDPAFIGIYDGVFTANQIESFGLARDATIEIGTNGTLIVEGGYLADYSSQTDPERRSNPAVWIDTGALYAGPGLELVVAELGGGGVQISTIEGCYTINFPTDPEIATVGQTKSLTVTLAPGLNDTQPTTFDLVSLNPSTAAPQGAVGGVLSVTIPAGASNTTNILWDALAPGSTTFSMTNATGQYCIDATSTRSVSVFATGATESKSEPFTDQASATTNGWVEYNSRTTTNHNFGFSDTGNASGLAGEAGGTFVRMTDRAHYADTEIGYLTLNDYISASGQLKVTFPSEDATFNVGYFNTNDVPGGRNILGFSIGEGSGAIPYPNSRIWAAIGTATTDAPNPTEAVATAGIYPGDTYNWAFVYDPTGGPTGVGQLILSFTNTFDLTETSVTNDISSDNRFIGANFNAFGLLIRGHGSSTNEMEFYIDELTYTVGPPLEAPLLTKIEVGIAGDPAVEVTWESLENRVYAVSGSSDLTDPGSWSVLAPAIAGQPMQTTWTSDAPEVVSMQHYRVSLVQTIFLDDFESGDNGWTVARPGDAGTNWEFGTPDFVNAGAGIAITNAASGANAWGTNLDSWYTLHADVILTSPEIDIPAVPNATVSWKERKDIDNFGGMTDKGVVNVIVGGTPVQVGSDSLGTTDDWVLMSAPLPPAALGQTVQLEFRFTDDGDTFDDPSGSGGWGGWYIDDVEVNAR